MDDYRARLANAARRSMIQRAELQRKVGVAKQAFMPGALVSRGKYRANEALEDAAAVATESIRENRVPLALGALAGAAWYFREPIKQYVPRAFAGLRELFDGIAETINPSSSHDTDEAEALAESEGDDEQETLETLENEDETPR